MVSVSYGTTTLSESAIISRTPFGSSVESSRSLTSSSRRWLASWCSSSACWRSSRSTFEALTIAWAAYPAKIDMVVSSSASNRSRPSFERTITPWTRPRTSSGRRASTRAPRWSPMTTPRGSAPASPERIVSLCSATQPVSPSPIGDAERVRVGIAAAEERALERDRLAHPGGIVDAVDPDRVVVDEPAAPRRRSTRRCRRRRGCG